MAPRAMGVTVGARDCREDRRKFACTVHKLMLQLRLDSYHILYINANKLSHWVRQQYYATVIQ